MRANASAGPSYTHAEGRWRAVQCSTPGDYVKPDKPKHTYCTCGHRVQWRSKKEIGKQGRPVLVGICSKCKMRHER